MARSGQPFQTIVLAAGKGTRMKSSVAKVLHPVCGRPLGFYPIARALELHSRRVVVVVGHQARDVETRLRTLFPTKSLVFAEQREQRGTGHAVLSAKAALGASRKVLILNGDLPLLTAHTLKRLLRAGSRSAVALLTMVPDDPRGYGRILRDERGRVLGIVEHKDASTAQRTIQEINAGAYLVDKKLLFEVLGRVSRRNPHTEIYLTDVVSAAVRRGLRVDAIRVDDAAQLAGVNDRVELARAERTMRARINDALMRAGVTMENPEHTYIDDGVKVGRNTFLAAGVHLRGSTRVAGGVSIGPGTVIDDSIIANRVEILAHCVIEDAEVDARCRVGPFARLRPGTVLEVDVRIGNFVETKKTTMGRGAKASHLAYLGDATVGARSNVGAGTITCNYDGVNKFRTRIGKGVFIGTNASLVAPVTIGAGAYVAAGSTITRDIPPGDLGIARGVQKNVKGWVRLKAPRKKKRT